MSFVLKQIVFFCDFPVEEFVETQEGNPHDTQDLKNFLQKKPWSPEGKITVYPVEIRSYVDNQLIETRKAAYESRISWPPKRIKQQLRHRQRCSLL